MSIDIFFSTRRTSSTPLLYLQFIVQCSRCRTWKQHPFVTSWTPASARGTEETERVSEEGTSWIPHFRYLELKVLGNLFTVNIASYVLRKLSFRLFLHLISFQSCFLHCLLGCQVDILLFCIGRCGHEHLVGDFFRSLLSGKA